LTGGSGIAVGVFIGIDDVGVSLDIDDVGVSLGIDDVGMNVGWGLWGDEDARLGLVDANAAKADISASEL